MTNRSQTSSAPGNHPASTTRFNTERLLNSNTVCEHCGNISAMSLYRWRRDQGFPPPYVVIGGRNYWKLSDVRSWIELCANNRADALANSNTLRKKFKSGGAL